MVKILSLVLLVLLLITSRKRGLKTYITIYINLFLLGILLLLIGWGFNPIIPTFIIALIISLIILFFLNGVNKKTISAFISVFLILIIFVVLTYIFGNKMYIQGYTGETIEEVAYLNINTGINMLALSNSIIIIGLIGNIVDTSIAISSALYEVHLNNKKLKVKELFFSGMNIGHDILGTTINTLFFAYIGGYASLLIYFQDFHYSFLAIINSKLFADEFTSIILSAIASFLIIPVSSIITSLLCKYEFDDLKDYIIKKLKKVK